MVRRKSLAGFRMSRVSDERCNMPIRLPSPLVGRCISGKTSFVLPLADGAYLQCCSNSTSSYDLPKIELSAGLRFTDETCM